MNTVFLSVFFSGLFLLVKTCQVNFVFCFTKLNDFVRKKKLSDLVGYEVVTQLMA